MQRLDSLDYLRGIMALSVMLYHYSSWTFGTLGGEYILGKLGIYAVSIFYILSGLSLTLVYHKKILSMYDVRSFFIKRLFRIFPLFWIAVTAAIAFEYLSCLIGNNEFKISPYTIFLNYSLLFGFLEPTAYLSTGAWSIGNEMVFYAILPFIFLLQIKNKFIFPVFMMLSIFSGIYFSFFALSQEASLSEQWGTYINPFNQLFLFLAGVAIGLWGKKINNIMCWGMTLIALAVFIFWPAEGDKIQIVTGINRWVLSIVCIMVVFMLYVMKPTLPQFSHNIFSFLGQGCYSIYLLHPLVAFPIVYIFSYIGIDKGFAYIFSLFATLILSWITFKYIESPMMNYGKLLSHKRSNDNNNQN